jgi:hypothetical protein
VKYALVAAMQHLNATKMKIFAQLFVTPINFNVQIKNVLTPVKYVMENGIVHLMGKMKTIVLAQHQLLVYPNITHVLCHTLVYQNPCFVMENMTVQIDQMKPFVDARQHNFFAKSVVSASMVAKHATISMTVD